MHASIGAVWERLALSPGESECTKWPRCQTLKNFAVRDVQHLRRWTTAASRFPAELLVGVDAFPIPLPLRRPRGLRRTAGVTLSRGEKDSGRAPTVRA